MTKMLTRLQRHQSLLQAHYPWTIQPLIISAPMLAITGPRLATAVSSAGGIGIIGPRRKPQDLSPALAEARSLLQESQQSNPKSLRWHKDYSFASATDNSIPLPIGVGFQTWTGGLEHAEKAIAEFRPAIAWLFAPREGQAELDHWTSRIREVSEGKTKVWIQVGSVADAVAAAKSKHRPDLLVVQGQDAGGHGLWRGAGLVTLVPEVVDAIGSESDLPVIAAGGIADGRGVVSVMALGAAGVAMGTRFLASKEADVGKGYQDEVVRAADGGQTTVRTTLYNALRGTKGWPEIYAPRTIINRSYVDDQAGMTFEENEGLYQEAVARGDEGWGPDGRLATYSGTGIGLVRDVSAGADIVEQAREQASSILKDMGQV